MSSAAAKTVADSPWIAQFDGLLARETIRARAENVPEYDASLRSLPDHLAVEKLRETLMKVVILSEEDVDVLQKLLERSHAHTVKEYSSTAKYVATLHRREMSIAVPPPICLTGLAGVGKSCLQTALTRLLPPPSKLLVGSDVIGGMVDYKSYARIKVEAGTKNGELMSQWLPEENVRKSAPLNSVSDASSEGAEMEIAKREDIVRAKRHAYKMGYCASLIDEMQFLTQGASANAKVTQFLLRMSYIGVPLCYAANYSLCRKLKKRNHEDRDRLLAKVIVLKPLELSQDGIGRLLRAYDRVLGDYVDGSLCNFLAQYAGMTLGIRRKVLELTVAAFEEMRSRGERTLTLRHLEGAHKKRISVASKEDVRLVLEMQSTGQPPRGRLDLWSPFDADDNRLVSQLPSLAVDTLPAQISATLLLQSLTAREKNAVKSFAQTGDAVQAAVPSEPLKSKSGKPELNAAELLRNTVAHNAEAKAKRQANKERGT